MKNGRGSSGSPRHTESYGPGSVAGAEEQDRKGGSSLRGSMNSDAVGTVKAAGGSGKVPNHTRGREEDES